MIKEAIEKIIELSGPETIDVDGRTYAYRKWEPVKGPKPDTLNVKTLTGFVDYLKDIGELDGIKDLGSFIHIESYKAVSLRGPFDNYGVRVNYIRAIHTGPVFQFGNWYSPEEFIILAQSLFEQSDAMRGLIKQIGNLAEQDIKTIEDDGVTQEITVKTGVAVVGQVQLNPIIELIPYRTFLEVTQPKSDFLIRLRKPGPQIALFEADGGAWELLAIQSIGKWLEGIVGEEFKIIA